MLLLDRAFIFKYPEMAKPERITNKSWLLFYHYYYYYYHLYKYLQAQRTELVRNDTEWCRKKADRHAVCEHNLRKLLLNNSFILAERTCQRQDPATIKN